MVTIQDVARAAGVSPMTVSNVINSHAHVRDTTREKVLRVIDDLGYTVNVAARSLRTGRTGTIGLAVPEVDRPYFAQLSAAIIQEAGAHGVEIAIEQTGAVREQELGAIARSRHRRYDGLILETVGLGPEDKDLLRVDYPVVLLGERIFDGPLDHVSMPNAEGAEAAVAHLVATGRRRIAVMEGGPDDPLDRPRLQGYLRGLTAAGLEIDEQLVRPITTSSLEVGAAAARLLVDSGVECDAIFCMTDTLALGALRGFADRGVRVPEDIAVVGFDDITEASYCVPSLTSVAPDIPLIARTAVEFLLDRIADSSRAPREFISPFLLAVRESTAPRSARGHHPSGEAWEG